MRKLSKFKGISLSAPGPERNFSRIENISSLIRSSSGLSSTGVEWFRVKTARAISTTFLWKLVSSGNPAKTSHQLFHKSIKKT